MKKLTRREFLRLVTIGAGGLVAQQVLSSCQPERPAPTQVPQQKATTAPIPAAKPSPTVISGGAPASTESIAPTNPVPSPQGKPDLVVARGSDPEQMVRQAMAALGGMEQFVTAGANVVIKPNICVAYHTYEYAATTNPWVVGALVRMALEAGASSVRVFDFPFGGSAQEAYVKSGIGEQVKSAGGEMIFMPGFKYVTTEIPDGKHLKRTDIFDEVLKADVIIDAPIVKHHSSAGLTIGMKNLMGVIRDRGAMHQNLGQRIADLNTRIRPHLVVVDAIRMLMAHGPAGGSLDDVRVMNTLLASRDVVAADSYAATLFGVAPESIPHIAAASKMGIGNADLSTLKIEEIAVGA